MFKHPFEYNILNRYDFHNGYSMSYIIPIIEMIQILDSRRIILYNAFNNILLNGLLKISILFLYINRRNNL